MIIKMNELARLLNPPPLVGGGWEEGGLIIREWPLEP